MKRGSFPNSEGIVPCNWFELRPKNLKAGSFPTSVGIVPCSWVFWRTNVVKAVSMPMLVGIVPPKFVSRMSKVFKQVNSPISVGILPLNAESGAASYTVVPWQTLQGESLRKVHAVHTPASWKFPSRHNLDNTGIAGDGAGVGAGVRSIHCHINGGGRSRQTWVALSQLCMDGMRHSLICPQDVPGLLLVSKSWYPSLQAHV